MKVCFVTSYLYPYLKDEYPDDTIGGAEYQQKQIINALQSYNEVDVSVVSLDYGQQDGEIIKGVRVWKSYKKDQGVRFIRFFVPALSGLWRALGKADADIYYIRAASFMLFPVWLYCRLHGKKYIFSSAHDTDFKPGEEIVSNFRDLWCYKFGMLRSDLIVNQTINQQSLLKSEYGLDGVVIRNFSENKVAISENNNVRKTILWVATIRRFKRAEFLLDIAEMCPEYDFIMVGGEDGGDRAYYQEISQRAKSIPNVNFVGFVPPNKVDAIFSTANIFINTSIHEGFPNTFLQAWSKGLPVITFFDPDNVVEENTLGVVVEKTSDVKDAIKQVSIWDEEKRQDICVYFENNHGQGVVETYVQQFQALTGKYK